MNNVSRVKEITEAFCRNRNDRETLDRYFDPEFDHWANGRHSSLSGYASHLARYGENYDSFSIKNWDEAFAADDKVITSYTLEGQRRGGGADQFAVMAIWRLRDGKVVSLREVDAQL